MIEIDRHKKAHKILCMAVLLVRLGDGLGFGPDAGAGFVGGDAVFCFGSTVIGEEHWIGIPFDL